MIKLLKNINIKTLLYTISIIMYLVMFLINIFKSSFVYSFPLFFETCILMLKKIKYKKVIILNKLDIIKDIILFFTLIVGIISINLLVNEFIIKILLTLTILIEIIVFVRYNSLKLKSKKNTK